MPARLALSFAALTSQLLLAGCAIGLGADIAPSHSEAPSHCEHAWASGSASDESDMHGNHDHRDDHDGHDHDHHDHSHAVEPHASWSNYEVRRETRVPDAHDAHDHNDHAGDHGQAPRQLLRTNLRHGWCAPAEHNHASACDTPFVHGFLTEPAFLGRDLFVDVTRSDDETEIEVELEWSLSKRLGLIAELPYIDADESGIGDAALGLRALLIEEHRFLLSASTEVEIPTGSESRGLGSGSFAFGASLHTWIDLGFWVTLQTASGIEHVPDEDETEFKWSATLAKSFRASPIFRIPNCGGHDHGPTVFNLIAEIQGVTALSEDAGETKGRWLLGMSYPLTHNLDLRGAFSQTFGGDEDEEAWTVGFIFHF